jgi:hypothetical protein
MKIIVTVLLVSFTLLLVYFLGCFKQLANELVLPNQNPVLIEYLQGNWVSGNDKKAGLRIHRDSIMEINADTIKTTKHLQYKFIGQAGNYFSGIDTSFNFSSLTRQEDSDENFLLLELNEGSKVLNIYHLVYVSKSSLQVTTGGKTMKFIHVK